MTKFRKSRILILLLLLTSLPTCVRADTYASYHSSATVGFYKTPSTSPPSTSPPSTSHPSSKIPNNQENITLPKTGEQNNTLFTLSGLGLLASGAMIYTGKKEHMSKTKNVK